MESLEVSAKTVDEAVEIALQRLDARLSEVEIVVLSEGRAGILGLGAEEARIRVTKLGIGQTGRTRISGANFPPRPPTISYAAAPGAPQDEDDYEEEELGPSTLEQRPPPASQRDRRGGQRGGPGRPAGGATTRPPAGGGGPTRPAGGPGRAPQGAPQGGGGQRSGPPAGGGRGPDRQRGGERGRNDRRQPSEPALQPQRRTDRELPAPPPPSSPLAEEAQTIIQEMVNKMGLHAVVVETQVPVSEAGESTPSLAFDILGDDLGSLIGRRGQTLSSMQYLVNLIMRQRHKEPLMVLVDVEGYRARRYQTLQNLAQRMAERVRSTGQTVTLEPMTAAERRIIHMTLKEFPDLSTQSVGEGENRKVTIVPKRK